MTEWEKMLAGLPYDPSDPDLTAARRKAQALCRQINRAEDEGERVRLLKALFGASGEELYLEPNFRCDYGFNIRVGENFYANYDCIMLDSAPITIGADCMFAPRVSLFTATHPVEARLRCWQEGIPYAGEYAKPITIGDQVWLGGGVIVNPGVTIGDRTVVASGSVVVRDLPPDCVAAGNPAVVKKRLVP